MPTTVDLHQNDPLHPEHINVPRIDSRQLLAEPDQPILRAALDRAMHTTGFLYLSEVFAGVEASATLEAQMRSFFALADDDPGKRAVCVSGKTCKHGWMPLYGEPAYQPGTLAHVESFDYGRPARSGDEPALGNRWPEQPGFRDAARSAWSILTSTGLALLEAIAVSARLERRYLADRCRDQDRSTMRLLRYPGGYSPLNERDVGIAAHTDFECITLLYQSAPGLELLDAGGHWRDAPAGSELVVVLFGDMLERFTNGTVRATGHRVRRSPHERYSVVLFFAVNDDVVVEPLPGFVGPGHPARYAPVTQPEHSAREIARSEAYRDQEPRA